MPAIGAAVTKGRLADLLDRSLDRAWIDVPEAV